MEKYKSLYLWMFVPFLIAQIGIFNYYWPKFASVTWEIHIHYWLVSLRYLLVIIQPYLIVNGKVSNHKTLGIFGFLLAGGVIFTGFSLLDIPLKLVESYVPGRPGPPIAFYYGTLLIEFLLMVAFIIAVSKSIIHRYKIDEHAWWLICSAFYMIGPALGRGMIVFWRSILSPEKFTPLFPIITTELIYLTIFILFVRKFGKFNHLATYLGLSLVIVRLLRFPLGSSETVQQFLQAVIKW